MEKLDTLSQTDRLNLCGDRVQKTMSKLFDYGFDASEIATGQLRLFSAYALLGMSRERAAEMLRETAIELERCHGDVTKVQHRLKRVEMSGTVCIEK